MFKRVLTLGVIAFGLLAFSEVQAQSEFAFDVTGAVVKVVDEDGNWGDWSDRIDLETNGKFIQEESKVIIYGEEKNQVYNLQGSAETEEDDDGNTYMSFVAETAGGEDVEVMFMFTADDEDAFLLLISWDELMIAYDCEL
jgi:hypothetical protein